MTNTIEALIEELPKEIAKEFTLSVQYVHGEWYAGYDDLDGQAYACTENKDEGQDRIVFIYQFDRTLAGALTKLKEALIEKGFMAENEN